MQLLEKLYVKLEPYHTKVLYAMPVLKIGIPSAIGENRTYIRIWR